MEGKPARSPWEAELEAAVLAEEYAKRGEQFTTQQPAEPAVDPPAQETGSMTPANAASSVESALDEADEEQLVRQFEIEFLKQDSRDSSSAAGRLGKFLASSEGRVVLITVIAIIVLVLIGRLLGSSISAQITPQP